MPQLSPLQKQRLKYHPKLPKALQDIRIVSLEKDKNGSPLSKRIADLFPLTSNEPLLKFTKGSRPKISHSLRVGIVLSGGQAPGGHNVISGLYDAIKAFNEKSSLIGFLNGPGGIVKNDAIEITGELLEKYRNQGGFDLIGSGRTKIETDDQFKAALAAATERNLDGLIVTGGDDSNTNAALLAEYFAAHQCKTVVIGVPKTIDGDLKNPDVAISFGFDTACKTYSEMIGNIARDALSAKKYYHFIRLMGRSASHITLECAFATQPNLALIGEEIAREKKTLNHIVSSIADLICRRAELDKHFGIILIPEGVIEFIPEIGALIKELNALLSISSTLSSQEIHNKLTSASQSCFSALPEEVQKQLLLHRDPHGNVQVSFIETEKLLMHMVDTELSLRQTKGTYHGNFNGINHFFGYEGRCGFPSNFDCNYCYALGYTAALLIKNGMTGYMCAIHNLTLPPSQWEIAAVPLTSLMDMEMRKGKEKPVIQKALVDLNGKAFAHFVQHRDEWGIEDTYLSPGPIQFFGSSLVSESVPFTLLLES